MENFIYDFNSYIYWSSFSNSSLLNLYQKFKIMSYTNEELKKKMTVSENI